MARLLTALPVLSLLVLGAAPAQATAIPRATPRFIAIDLGTLGGPDSAPDDPGASITEGGVVVGSADTAALNPFPHDPGCLSSPCHVNDEFEWHNGVMTDLGALHGYSAGIFELNRAGVGPGVSETGRLDPLTGVPETHAVISKNGGLVDLGTLGGRALCSVAEVVNARGQAVGEDSDCRGNALAAMLWEHGAAYNLNHLIGRSPLHLGEAFYISNRGWIGCLATLPNGDMHVAVLVPASQAAGQGLSTTSGTGVASAQQWAIPRAVPDPRDQFASMRQRLAVAISPRFQ